ncbi:T9SS type A sorting domain-containing protein [Parasediminibacterium sp. JCM 36343]|uniref:T9SS type A sorting domain-containing protein n=1 Tax=Parasediminibacterium sp. JCM 36343 TaxID=3374279 RepID=UPI00397AA1C4
MKACTQFFISLLVAFGAMGQSTSPTVVSSAGGTLTAGGVSVSYTVGQPAGVTLTSGGITLSQGFEQPTYVIRVTPTISISVPATTICSGSSATFTALATNGGTSPAYQWKKNGIAITGATASTYTTAAITNGDSISCSLISSADNAYPKAATSNTLSMGISTAANTWTGVTSTNWVTPGNWCSGTVPASGADVTIPVQGSGSYPVLAANTTIGNLTINTGASLNLNGKILTLTGSTTGTGYIKGSASSSIIVNSTSTSVLYFNPSGTDSLLNSLIINGTGGAKLGNGLGITNLLTLNAGNLNLNGQHLTLKSTSIASTAIVGPVAGGATITGNVTVERYIPKGYKAFRELGTGGVYNAGSIFSNWQEGGSKPAGYGTYITGNKSNASGYNATTGLDNTTYGYYGMYTYPTYLTFAPVTNTKTTLLDPYAGYHLVIYGDRTANIYASNFDASPLMANATTLRTTGQLVTGTVTFSSTGVTGAYNSSVARILPLHDTGSFIANPYPCAIDWEALSKTGLSNYYYYFDPTMLTTAGYQVFVAYNATSHTSNNPLSKINRYIQPGQGFWVQTNSNTTTTRQLVITEANKVTNQPLTAIFGAEKPVSRIAVSLWKDAAGIGNINVDGTVAAFDDRFTRQYGDEDSRKMLNEKENLSLVEEAGALELSIDGLPSPKQGDVLSLKLSQLAANTIYRLQVDAGMFKAEGLQAYLQDAYLGKQIAIGSDATVYEFSSTGVATESSNRFSIVFGKAAATTPIAEIGISKLVVYPNPAKNHTANVQLANLAKGSYTISVYNALGQQVILKNIWHNGGTASYPMSLKVAKGVFTVKATDAAGKAMLQTQLLID